MSSEQTPSARQSEQAFRQLRAQLNELSGLCMALARSNVRTNLWQRVVRNAQAMLNVEGCSYYRREQDALRCEFLMCSALGLVTEEENSVPAIIAPISLMLADGRPDLSTAAGRALHSGQMDHIPNVTMLPNYSASRTLKFDQQMGYRTQSMLSVPVRFRQQPVSGVLQLINPRNAEGEVVEFDEDRMQLAAALASTIALAQHLNPLSPSQPAA